MLASAYGGRSRDLERCHWPAGSAWPPGGPSRDETRARQDRSRRLSAVLRPAHAARRDDPAATVLALGIRLFTLTRPGFLTGVSEYDDGVYLGAAIRLTQGALPYRDFAFVQPPGMLLLDDARGGSRQAHNHDGGDSVRADAHRSGQHRMRTPGREPGALPRHPGDRGDLRDSRSLSGRHSGRAHAAA